MKTKKISLFVLSLIGISISIWFFLSALFGYFLGKFLSGKKEGASGKIKSLKIEFEKYIIHLHHWILVLACVIITYWLDIYKFPFYLYFLGGCWGLILQEIYQYNDWYKVIKKNPK